MRRFEADKIPRHLEADFASHFEVLLFFSDVVYPDLVFELAGEAEKVTGLSGSCFVDCCSIGHFAVLMFECCLVSGDTSFSYGKLHQVME